MIGRRAELHRVILCDGYVRPLPRFVGERNSADAPYGAPALKLVVAHARAIVSLELKPPADDDRSKLNRSRHHDP